MLEGGYDVTVQELPGHRDVRTTMINAHALNRAPAAERSPVDSVRAKVCTGLLQHLRGRVVRPPQSGPGIFERVHRMIVMPLYHATLTCSGLTEAEGSVGARDVEAGFRERPWHQNVVCRWDGSRLWIEADNDYDPDGCAIYDEFWDEIFANINFSGSIAIEIVSVTSIPVGG